MIYATIFAEAAVVVEVKTLDDALQDFAQEALQLPKGEGYAIRFNDTGAIYAYADTLEAATGFQIALAELIKACESGEQKQ
jgi:hypothetical protein